MPCNRFYLLGEARDPRRPAENLRKQTFVLYHFVPSAHSYYLFLESSTLSCNLENVFVFLTLCFVFLTLCRASFCVGGFGVVCFLSTRFCVVVDNVSFVIWFLQQRPC